MNKVMIDRILKLTAFVLTIAVASSTVFAEKGRHGKKNGHKGFDIEKMRQHLSLTDVQVKKIETIKKQYQDRFKTQRETIQPKQKKLRELLQADNVDINQVETQMRAMSEDRIKMRLEMIKMRNEIGNVLTKEQKQKMAEKRKQRQEDMKKKGDKYKDGKGRKDGRKDGKGK